MRIPEYLSPSALGVWEKDREEFYKRYLASTRPLRQVQTPAMAVGSSFDAYVKSALHRDLEIDDPDYEFDTLFEAQVDTEVRDVALAAGAHVFEAYQYSGSYDALLGDLKVAEEPQFEFTIKKVIDGVPLLGKPDCRYIHSSGAHVILDWKVNGYYSKYSASPAKLFSMAMDGQDGKPSRGIGRPHKNFKPVFFKGMTIGSHFLEDSKKEWADQLAIYGWMLDEPVGTEDMVARIDQIVAKPGDPPTLRVANHVARISEFWQHSLITRLKDCWEIIQGGHIFQDLPRGESDALCEVLDMVVEDMREDDDPIWQQLRSYR